MGSISKLSVKLKNLGIHRRNTLTSSNIKFNQIRSRGCREMASDGQTDRRTDGRTCGRTDGRTDEAATICLPLGEHKKAHFSNIFENKDSTEEVFKV